MSREKIDRLRAAFDAFNGGDFDAALTFAHPDIEFVPPGGQTSYKGIESFRAWMEPDAFEIQVIEPLDFIVAGNRILVRQRSTARGAGSGIELELSTWNVWTFDDEGLVTRVETYLEHEEPRAREAAGLTQ